VAWPPPEEAGEEPRLVKVLPTVEPKNCMASKTTAS
jgi:hypothetical protein